VTIPGCVDGMTTLIGELGSLDLAKVLGPAIALANDGFEASSEQAAAFHRQAEIYRDNPAVSGFFPEGRPIAKGDRVTRRDLARTLEAIADGGRDAFYGGTAGEDISSVLGELISLDDMAVPQAEWVDPIGIDVAGLTAWTVPPNSQGYLGPATLAVFEMLDPPSDPTDPMWWHLLIEAYRCLAWERDDLVSDPLTSALPADLLMDRERLERATLTIDRDRAGVWPSTTPEVSSTAYLCAADARGMAVSIIQSNYRGTGSPFGAARSGFLLQDRGLGFTLTPGHPNELAPGKRPLHTLSPTLWTEGNQPRWVLGTRGGGVQPQLIAQLGAQAIIGGVPLEPAQEAPRWTTAQFGPGSGSQLALEPGVPSRILGSLEDMGHAITTLEGRQPGWGPMSIIELDGADRRAAADPRVDTTAAVIF
jgi:gamma-glutamyltranspeptidase / glutathione hydrolase